MKKGRNTMPIPYVFVCGCLLLVLSPAACFISHGKCPFRSISEPLPKIYIRQKDHTVTAATNLEGNEKPPKTRKAIPGKPHTKESKAKISAANKGNVPWNKGRRHSEETRRKIAETLSLKAAEAKAAKHAVMLSELGITREEWSAQQEAQKKIPRNFSLSEGHKKNISDAVKSKWENPEYRAHMSKIQKGKPVRVHSSETRMKISQTLKKRWATNETYRKIMTKRALNQTIETRARISSTLPARCEDPAFREKLANINQSPRTLEHRQHISEAVKAKWEDEEYRSKALAGIRRASENRTVQPRQNRKPRASKPKSTPGVSVRRKKPIVSFRAKCDDVIVPRPRRPNSLSSASSRKSSKSTSSNSEVKEVRPAKKPDSKKGKGLPLRIVPRKMHMHVQSLLYRRRGALLQLAAWSMALPAAASATSRTCIENEVQGAYESDCMRESSRTFEWQSTGELVLEQGKVGPGETGAAVWNAGAALADYLATNPRAVEDKLVLELGCGTGLCGLVASRVGARAVLLTDGVELLLERAQRNIEANVAEKETVTTRKLQWSAFAVEEQLRDKFDVVLASDVLYQAAAWRDFGETAHELLKPETGQLLLAEAGHEKTPTQPTLEGFRAVVQGCGLVFQDQTDLLGGTATLQCYRKRPE